jgi:hypothetical protein
MVDTAHVRMITEGAETALASATTTDLKTVTGRNISITGTTTITGLGTADAGLRKCIRFAGILTLTHNAASLIIPGGANITTAAGDRCEAVSLGSGNWLVFNYVRANGLPLAVLFSTANTWIAAQDFSADVLPTVTETTDLGSASREWDNVYSQNAVTVSDERRKIDLGVIDGDQALAFIMALEPRLFRFRDTIVPATEDSPEKIIKHRRPHSGFFAQQVKAAMDEVGIEDCGVYAYNPENDTHELRLFEMIAWQTAAIKHLAERQSTPAPSPVAGTPAAPEQASPVPPVSITGVAIVEEGIPDDLDLRWPEGLPPLEERLVDPALASLMSPGETVSGARRRLWPLLNAELSRLRNEEALIGKTIPRRAEVEYLIGVLARMGEV